MRRSSSDLDAGIAATSLIAHLQLERIAVRPRTDRGFSADWTVFLTSFSPPGPVPGRCAPLPQSVLPVLIAGFAAQDKLVQGLSLGAVK